MFERKVCYLTTFFFTGFPKTQQDGKSTCYEIRNENRQENQKNKNTKIYVKNLDRKNSRAKEKKIH